MFGIQQWLNEWR